MDIKSIEGKKLCIVFCKLKNEDKFGRHLDGTSEEFDIKTMHGRASVLEDGKVLACMEDGGACFKVPPSAYNNIFENDGTPILKDADYFCMVKVSGMEL